MVALDHVQLVALEVVVLRDVHVEPLVEYCTLYPEIVEPLAFALFKLTWIFLDPVAAALTPVGASGFPAGTAETADEAVPSFATSVRANTRNWYFVPLVSDEIVAERDGVVTFVTQLDHVLLDEEYVRICTT